MGAVSRLVLALSCSTSSGEAAIILANSSSVKSAALPDLTACSIFSPYTCGLSLPACHL